MKLIGQKKDIESYIALDQEIYFQSSIDLKLESDNEEIRSPKFECKVCDWIVFNNKVYGWLSNGKVFLLDKKNVHYLDASISYSISNSINSKFIIGYTPDLFDRECFLVNLESEEKVKFKNRITHIINDIPFGLAEHSLTKFKTNGKKDWVKDLSDWPSFTYKNSLRKPEFVKIIGVFGDYLLINISPFKIMSVNIASGEQAFVSADFTEALNIVDYFAFEEGYSSRTIVDWHIVDTKVHVLSRYFYIVYDLLNNNWELKKSYLNVKNEWCFNRSLINDKVIVFVGAIGGWQNNYCGIFDIGLEDVISYQKLEKGYYENDFSFIEEKVYIRDNLNVLYVFSINNQ